MEFHFAATPGRVDELSVCDSIPVSREEGASVGLNPGLNQRCGQAMLPRDERVAQVAAG